MYQINIIKKIKIEGKETEKKRQHGCEFYKNLSEDEKNKLVDYRKK